jgi:hypothetical protein
MFNLIAQAGYASTTVNFTDDFSLLIAGLIGFVWVSVGMLVAVAVRDWISQGTRSTTRATPYVNEYRHAA